MVKLKEDKWKTVDLNPAVFKGDCEGLVGLEELTEYNIEEFKEGSNGITTVSSTKQKRKRRRKRGKQKDNESKETKLSKPVTNENGKQVIADRSLTTLARIKKIKKKQIAGVKEKLLSRQQVTDENRDQSVEVVHLAANKFIIADSSPVRNTKKRKKKQKDSEKGSKLLKTISNKNEKESFETKKITESDENIKKKKQKSRRRRKSKQSIIKENENKEQLNTEESETSKVEHCKVDEDESDLIPWNLIGVPKLVTKALLDQGFKEPTEIQVRTFQVNYLFL